MTSINIDNLRKLLEKETKCDENILPPKLKAHTTSKAKRTKFEEVDESVYGKEARMVAFKTTRGRLLYWLKALDIYYYE